jgi:hypothetical protein
MAEIDGGWRGRDVNPGPKGTCVENGKWPVSAVFLVSWTDAAEGWYEAKPVVNRVVCEVFCENCSDGLSSTVDEMATDETVEGKSLASNPGQNMPLFTSGRSCGNAGFLRSVKPFSCPGGPGKMP